MIDMTGTKCMIDCDKGKPTRRVSFQEGSGKIHKIENAGRLSKREKLKRWVSVPEFAEYKKDSIVAVKELRKSGNTNIFLYRGLEMVAPDSIARRRERHKRAITAVLKMQDKQQLNGYVEPKELKKVYKPMVTDSMREALENAYMDRMAIEEYVNSSECESTTKDVLKGRGSQQSRPRSKKMGGLFSRRSSGVSSSSSWFSTISRSSVASSSAIKRSSVASSAISRSSILSSTFSASSQNSG